MRQLELGRTELAQAFAKLGAEKRIVSDQLALKGTNHEATDVLSTEGYWNGLMENLVRKEVGFNWSFRERASNFV